MNSETDFVARNESFQKMVGDIATAALHVDDVEALKAASLGDKSVEDTITDTIATIGENMSLRRMGLVTGGNVATYVHNAVTDGMGAIGVLVSIEGDNAEFARQVAMHVAATAPQSLSETDLDADLVARERQVLTEQARESGKPEAVIEKMIEGRLRKFYEEVTLLNQKFVINPDLSVKKAAEEAGVTVTGFVRMAVGEGIEREEEDFAAEVAKTMGS